MADENVGVLKVAAKILNIQSQYMEKISMTPMRDASSIAQKRLMYIYFDEMISNGHLDASLDDIQFSGDFEEI